MNKIHIVNFAGSFNKNYYLYQDQERLNQNLKNIGFDSIFSYTEKDLPLSFYKKHKSLFDGGRWFGYGCWKPYIIKKIMNNVNKNDIVFYSDIGTVYRQGFKEYLEHLFENHRRMSICGWNENFKNREWCKHDTFYLMNQDKNECHNSKIVATHMIAIKKNELGKLFLNEWQKYNSRKKVVDHIERYKDSLEGYQGESRADMSVVSILFYKMDIQTRFEQNENLWKQFGNRTFYFYNEKQKYKSEVSKQKILRKRKEYLQGKNVSFI